MFWVIQNNMYNEEGFHELMRVMERLEIPHHVVKVVPILDKIIPADFDTNAYRGDMDDVPEVEIDPNQKIMVCGGISLSRVAVNRGWKPGCFNNENFHYLKWQEAVGKQLLNPNVFVDTFRNIGIPDQEFFIRPCEDTKAFSGTVMTPDEFDSWRRGVLALENDIKGGLNGDTMVTIAPLKKIYSEHRFFVVDKRIVAQSQYKLGDRVVANEYVPQDVIDFAKRMIGLWEPSRAFVIDIAQTQDGPKIIEYNGLNSAGFYKCDVGRIVTAIESMQF